MSAASVAALIGQKLSPRGSGATKAALLGH